MVWVLVCVMRRCSRTSDCDKDCDLLGGVFTVQQSFGVFPILKEAVMQLYGTWCELCGGAHTSPSYLSPLLEGAASALSAYCTVYIVKRYRSEHPVRICISRVVAVLSRIAGVVASVHTM